MPGVSVFLETTNWQAQRVIYDVSRMLVLKFEIINQKRNSKKKSYRNKNNNVNN